MVYEYTCKTCGTTMDVIKSVSEMDRMEHCDRGHDMQRVFCFRGQISTGSFRAGYYPSFGKTFTNAHQLNDEIRRLNYEEGKRVIEVGNEREAMKKLKPPKRKPDLEGAAYEMKTKKVDWNA